ncbi:MAG: hypothetical protein KDC48_18610, partial [Planctomycetes bacterium]|nr:hypothetical protein [Planctomycetota bacterium]
PEFPASALPADIAVVRRCLAKDADARFQSVAELLRALRAPVALGESLMLPRGATLSPPPASVQPPTPPASAPGTAVPPPLPGGMRDPRQSPYGMPWAPEGRSSGLVGGFVRALFAVFEAISRVLLLPIRGIASFTGKGGMWLLRLPFTILGLLARLIGLLVVVALIVLIVVTVLGVLSAA